MNQNLEQDSRAMDYAGRLSRMIQLETVSEKGKVGGEKFRSFHTLLEQEFPHIAQTCTRENFHDSLLWRWKGRCADREPILLMNHFDVVEASGEWLHGPFSGDIADGKVWGRGTLDDKGPLWAILQAVDELIAEGYVPEQDVYLETTCTEEFGGPGADEITQALKARGIHFRYVLDEGGMILGGFLGAGLQAMVAVGEKSFVDLKFIARSRGGHSSAPQRDTPLVRLGKFMAEADRAEIFDVQLAPEIREMFVRSAPYIEGEMKEIAQHPELHLEKLNESHLIATFLRTTLAFTMAHGSEGSNVVPQEAWIVGNMRVSHHQGVDSSIEAARKLAARYNIETEVLVRGYESKLCSYESAEFKLLENTIHRIFPGIPVVPYIMTAGSDCRFYSRVSENCLHFAPFPISEEQRASMHGIDENIDIATLAPAVDFIKLLIRNTDHM